MRIPIRISQIFVAILFIISGLVKANDPLGLGYKMQEFFELWTNGLSQGHFFARGMLISLFDFLHEHALALAVMMITLEIVTGVALLLGWMKRFIIILLLLLIIFFTFLTGYAYLSGKFTNCGCFGDCLPITPFSSFLKDLALLVLILTLLIGQKYILTVSSRRWSSLLLVASLIFSLALQWYALNYLPLVDCLPFKKGNNIAEQMKPPPGALADSTAIRFIYEKQGKRYEFAPENLPADFETYTYIDRIDRLVRKGNADPRIKGFALTDSSGQDQTQMFLNLPVVVAAFALDASKEEAWINSFQELAKKAQSKNIPVYFITSNVTEISKALQSHGINIPVLSCDFTVIRTAARTNPTVYVLKQGTIRNKYSYRTIGKATKEI
ncbi:MAG: BT_3928 family protein [Flavisolibacter sp.]